MMGYGVGPYIGLNEIVIPSPMMTFITIIFFFSIYLFVFLDLSIRIFVCAYK